MAGYQWSFYPGAGLALASALIPLLMIRSQPLDPDQEEAEMLELANRDR